MVTTLRDTRRKARKPWRCSMCNALIPVGTEHRVTTNAFDGRVYDWRECLACDDDHIVSEVSAWAGYPDEGVGIDSAQDWAHEERGSATLGPLAMRWLARYGCTCEDCTTSPASGGDG